MKIILLLTALCLLIATAFLSANNQTVELKVGDKAPSFSLYDQDNKLHKLSDYKGQRLIIYYFPKADTPGWTKEACGFRDIYSEYKRAGIKVFGISYDSSKSLKKFKNKYALPFDFLSDSKKEVAVQYGAAGTGWPRRITFIIDKNSRIEKIYKKMNVNTHAEQILDDLFPKK